MATQGSAADHFFVNYTHPSQRHRKDNRVAVSSFVNGQYRRKTRQIVLPERGRLEWKFQQSEEREIADEELETALVKEAVSINAVLARQVFQPSKHQLLSSSCPGGLRVDPFNSYPIEASSCVPNAVDYFIQRFAPSQVPALVAQQIENPLLSKLFPLAMQNVELFEAVIYLSHSYYVADTQKVFEASKASLYHRGNALSKLRDKLISPSTQVDDSTIATTVLLMGTDYLFDDSQAFEAHLKGLSHLIAARGGIENLGLGGSLKAMVLLAESRWTLMTGQKSPHSLSRKYRVLEYPRPESPEIQSILSQLPDGLRSVAEQGSFSIQVLNILQRMSPWIIYLERAQTKNPSPQEMMYLLQYDTRLDSEEATFCLDLSESGTIEQCICVGLLTFSLNVYNQARLCPAYQKMMRRFSDALDGFEPTNDSEKECYLWVTAVAAGAARGCPKEDEFNFASRLRAWLPKKAGWVDLEVILRKFLWYTPVARHWELSWIESTRRIKPRVPGKL